VIITEPNHIQRLPPQNPVFHHVFVKNYDDFTEAVTTIADAVIFIKYFMASPLMA